MCLAKFRHEFRPHLRSSFFQHFGQAPQPRSRHVLLPPCGHFHQEGEQVNAFFRKTVYGFLFVPGIMRLEDDSLFDELLQTIGQNIRRNPLHRVGQELAKMPSVHKNDVADNEQTPLIAKYLDCSVDKAF
jgi:hypothetical protein